MRRLGLLFGVCLSLGVSGFGCQSEGTQNPDGGPQLVDASVPTIMASVGCGELARAVCEKRVACSIYGQKTDGVSVEACATVVAGECDASINLPDSPWTSDAARACAQGYPSLTCDDFLTSNIPQACRLMGTRALGAVCGDSLQCQSMFCGRASATACGTCRAIPKLGEPCTGFCEYGAQCSLGTCVAYRKLAEVCDAEFECLPSLSCMSGTCQNPMVGGACNQPWECTFFGLQYCEEMSLSCKNYPLSVAKLGQTCGESATALVLCTRDAYCRSMSGAAFGVCTALPVGGEPCATIGSGTSARSVCRSPYVCRVGTCGVFDRAACK